MWRECLCRSIGQVISTGFEKNLRRSSGSLHARRKSRSRFRGILGYSSLGLWIQTCCVGVQSVSEFISVNRISDAQYVRYAWHITEEPVTRRYPGVVDAMSMVLWLSADRQARHPCRDPPGSTCARPASPEKKAGPKSIVTSAEKASPPVFSVRPTHALHSPLSTLLAQFLCLCFVQDLLWSGDWFKACHPPAKQAFSTID
jgi:hypothetical protein